jgi:UDP-N-acetylmuramate: L-alanyl-gamma-D-glutamyl-meso-diaminopimelate ligase
VLAVAGTHGKTTTTSLLAWMLEDAGLAPGFLVGGVPKNFGLSARLTDSPFFVIEADEYDTAFCDKRSKFVHYRPRTLILNNLEFDHADIFPDLAAIETQFHHLMPLVGRHNRANALAAIAAVRHVGVPPQQAIASLARFAGIKRRLEAVGEVGGVTVYDDFAHHPTAIALTIEGLRRRQPAGRILAVLEPRSNTMKLGVMKAELPGSLAQADKVYCYTHGLSWQAEESLAPLGERVRCDADLDALVAAVSGEALPGDHVLVMSNGGFGGVHGKLLDALAARFAVRRGG